MNCPKCGNYCGDSARFCTVCGTPLPEPQNNAQPSYDVQQPIPTQQGWQQYPQQPNQWQPNAPGTYPPNYAPQQAGSTTLGMAWFKFIIYFQLFAGAVLNLISGIQCLLGSQYDGSADFLYAMIPGLSAIDKIYGIVLIALAVFAIVTRMQLAGYRKNGPKFYLLLLVVNIAASLIYVIAGCSVINAAVSGAVSLSDFSTYIPTLIVNGVLLAVNVVYFKKRAHLFVN